jgi:hypothetical protein
MWVLIGSLAFLGIIAALFGYISNRKGESQITIAPSTASCATCSGSDPKCEQECVMEAATKEIEYFDDEELDQFKHKASDSYTNEEVELFSDIMYTMRPEEVKAWNRSLILREINFPNPLKDELIALIEEANSTNDKNDKKHEYI